MADYLFEPSNMDNLSSLIDMHIKSLAFPIDSWHEDQLKQSEKYELKVGGERAGYCANIEKVLSFFYVLPKHFRHAPALMEAFISRSGIERVYVLTHDAALCALISEWDFDIARESCFFIDSREPVQAEAFACFRTAEDKDCQSIRHVCGDFFEGDIWFDTLEECVQTGTIFVLEENGELLGCGKAEKGMFCKECVSIGMFSNPAHRKRGVARTILISLKEWAYQNGLIPVAGCWYYNTVSRKSLESAGMIAVSKGFEAILKCKEKPPLRTGNPPGELVE